MQLSYSEFEQHPINGEGYVERNEVFYIIVETRDEALAVACVQDFDLYDYSNVVSRYWFNEEHDAENYAAELAKKNGKKYEGTARLLD